MFEVRGCGPEDTEAVVRLIQDSYYPDEPLTRANGLKGGQPCLPRAVLPQGHSVLAVDRSGHPVGVALNDAPPQPYPIIYIDSEEDIQFQELFAYMERESRVMEVAPLAMEVRMFAVVAEWRRHGVARALLAASKEAARQAGCTHVKLYCTSNHSSRLAEQLGWRLLYSLCYQDYVDRHQCGIVPPLQPHTHCNLYIDTVDP